MHISYKFLHKHKLSGIYAKLIISGSNDKTTFGLQRIATLFSTELPVPFHTHESHVTDQGFLHTGRHCGLLLFPILDTHTGAVVAVCGDTLTVAFSDGLDGDHPPMFLFVNCGFLSENCVCKSFACFLTGLIFF